MNCILAVMVTLSTVRYCFVILRAEVPTPLPCLVFIQNEVGVGKVCHFISPKVDVHALFVALQFAFIKKFPLFHIYGIGIRIHGAPRLTLPS